MAEAAQIMQSAGMMPDALGYWNRYTAGVNMGKRIPIAHASDPSLSSYLFTAYHQNQIMDEIAQVVATSSGTVSRASMRQYLWSKSPAWHDAGDTYQLRYEVLRDAMINFYLGSGSIDTVRGRMSQRFGICGAEMRAYICFHQRL